MRAILALALLGSCVLACNGQDLDGQAQSREVQKTAYGSSNAGAEKPELEEAAPAPVSNAPEQTPIDPVELPVAIPPVAVAGAALHCRPVMGAAECLVQLDDQAPAPVFVRAYIIKSSTEWFEAVLTTISSNNYRVALPAGVVGSYGVSLVTADSQFVADVVENGPSNLKDVATDGDFETIRGFDGSSFYEDSSGLPWQARVAPKDSVCKVAFFEIVVASDAKYAPKAYNGSHYIDLNTTCTGQVGSASNPRIWQDVDFKADQLYVLRYAYRLNQNTPKNYFRAFVNGEVVSDLTVDNPQWTVASHTYLSPSDGGRVDFQEYNLSAVSSGTYLDGVKVFHLGALPK